MASIVLSSVGAALGNELLPGIGGRILGYYGRQAGRWIDEETGLRDKASGGGDSPRLESLRVQDSRYGIGIPLVFGCARVAGNIIWASNLIETAHESRNSGGKGGIVGGSGSSRTTYSYSLHCAVAICAGEIGGLATIWADSKIIYQNGIWKNGVVANATLYRGTMTQNADPLMESMIGSGKVPAYRGLAYVVFESLQLGNFGNRLPNLTFEVLPPDAAAQPEWLGETDTGIHHRANPLRNKGMSPLIVEGRTGRARKMLVGGYQVNGGSVAFNIIKYDVTGDIPVEVTRAQSAAFTVTNAGENSWGLAPDGRFIALFMKNVGGNPSHNFAIFDIENGQFGNIFSINLSVTDGSTQIAWIDAQRFVISDTQGGKRGVHVFARAGIDIVDLGFFDVWGVGTATTRVPLYYTQFAPISGGLLNYMADNSYDFTAIFVRHIRWQNGTIIVGEPYTLTSGYDTGPGSGASACLLRTGDGEWTLFYSTAIDMQMMSFRPGIDSAVITRPWQTITNNSFSTSTNSHPCIFGNHIVVAQRSSADNYYRVSEIALNSSSFELSSDGVVVGGSYTPVVDFGTAIIDNARMLFMGVKWSDDKFVQLGILRRRNTGDTMDNIVACLLQRAGYQSGDYDVSALADVAVDGYVVPDAMSAASAIAPLQIFEPFDLVESEACLRAVKRNNMPSAEISADENRATNKLEQEIPPSREQLRVQELDLPLEISIDYIDASRDYEISTQRARRSATCGAKSAAKIRLPLVCTAAKAKQIAEKRLFTLWAEREQVRLSWSRRWLAIDPGDVINLGDRLMRITRIRHNKGLLDVVGVLIPNVRMESKATADHGEGQTSALEEIPDSVLFVMDLPMLRASDDQPGVYVAISGTNGWHGATLWRAADGVNYGNLASFPIAATAGIATTALPDCPSWYIDRASTVNVQLLQGTLSSCTGDDLLSGANVALLGDEIIQFQTATLLGPGYYMLSNILRGRCGTENATGTHIAGERFVLLTENAVQFIPALLTDRGKAYKFRALSNGQTLGEAPDMNFTYGLATLRPLAPVHIEGSRSAGVGSDLIISWKRRVRKNGDWIDNVDVPLDEPEEIYDVEIMNGSTPIRTFTSVASSPQVYTAAEQYADWGSNIPSQFIVNVYQLSARYGRGEKGTAVV